MTNETEREERTDKLLSLAEAARYLGLSGEIVVDEVAKGRLRGARIRNRIWRFRKADLDAYFEQHAVRVPGGR